MLGIIELYLKNTRKNYEKDIFYFCHDVYAAYKRIG